MNGFGSVNEVKEARNRRMRGKVGEGQSFRGIVTAFGLAPGTFGGSGATEPRLPEPSGMSSPILLGSVRFRIDVLAEWGVCESTLLKAQSLWQRRASRTGK
jgi:hypothetical protein